MLPERPTTRSSSKLKSKNTMLLAHLGALLAVTMWGVSFVSTKVLLDNGMNPVEVYVYRFIIAYVLVLCFCHKRLMSHSWRDEMLFAVCGLCAGSIYFIAENTALEYTLVSNVSLLTSTSPLIVVLLVAILYKNDRPNKGVVAGSLVAFLGVACVIFNSSFNLEIRPLGDFLSLGAALGWSIYTLVLKKLNVTYDAWFVTRKTFFWGIVTALPFMLFEPTLMTPEEIVNNPTVLGNLLFLAVGASVVGYIMWARSVKSLGAVKSNNYLYFQSIVTLVVSAVWLHERVSAVGYTGCGLILLGLWLSDYLGRKIAQRGQ
ncbi:MAG: DMT family transporter [Muribaculaceae bacterium]|nr:DMT family transporter [Muribaculaceae bacterium]